MKKITILLLLIIAHTAFGQSFSAFNVDASSFPTIKAQFYAYDAEGNQITNMNNSDFEVKENGTRRNGIIVSCPSPKTEPLSIVLAVDVSIYNDIINAKSVLNAWLDIILLDKNEIAIMSYDGNSYINQDFTTDKGKLQRTINSLSTFSSGEDHTGALIRPITGAISVAKQGKYKPVVIVLSSCSHFDYSRQASIIEEAHRHNVTINFNIFDRYDFTPEICKNISQETGGFSNNHIPYNDLNTAINSIQMIVAVNKKNSCSIEWQSEVSCTAVITNSEVKLLPQNLKDNVSYNQPSSSGAKLEIRPSYIQFKNPPIGKDTTLEITVTAQNSAFTVNNITSLNTQSLYDISPKNFILNVNESKTLTITYRAADSSRTFTKFSTVTEQCNQDFYADAGWSGKKPLVPTLRVTHPNGGETFVIGSDTVITWEGVTPQDLVQIDYSIDNGKTWKYIDTSRGLSYKWKNVPKPISDKCLTRIQQNKEIDWTITLAKTIMAQVDNMRWSSDQRFIAINTYYGILILDAFTLDTIRAFPNTIHDNKRVTDIWISPDNKTLASSGWDGTVKLWDIESGSLLRTFIGHNCFVYSVCFHPNGKIIASGDYNGNIKLWDIESNEEITPFIDKHSSWVISLSFSPDGKSLASGSTDGLVKLWDVGSGSLLANMKEHSSDIREVVFSPLGDIIASTGIDGRIVIWNVSTHQKVKSIYAHDYFNIGLLFSPDGSMLISSGGSEKPEIKFWNILTGNLIHCIKNAHTSGINLSISPDGSMLISGGENVKLWYIDFSSLQSDNSDAVFAIVKPIPASHNIDMLQCLVGMDKDSLVVDFVQNLGSWKFRVDSIYFTGTDASAFSIVSGLPVYTLEKGENKATEFRFKPTEARKYEAGIVIITQTDTLRQTIQGEGVQPQLEVYSGVLDFGEVEIGNDKIIKDTVLLKNISSSPITITNTTKMSPDIEQFEIVSGGGSFTLPAYSEKKLTLQFKPKYGGRTSGRIGFEYNGFGSPAVAQLFGTGVGGMVSISSDSGYAGDKLNINLVLEKIKPEGMQAIASRFSAKMKFQGTILTPQDVSKITDFSNNTVSVALEGTIPNSNILFSLPVVAGLGNVEQTDIQISDFKLFDQFGNVIDYDVEYRYGTFTLLGICHEGGTRLINPNGQVKILSIAPTPSSDKIKIDFSIIEKGQTELLLINTLGEVVKTIAINTNSVGNKTEIITLDDVVQGQYLLVLKTPSHNINELIQVVK